jgi:hypothetical protein
MFYSVHRVMVPTFVCDLTFSYASLTQKVQAASDVAEVGSGLTSATVSATASAASSAESNQPWSVAVAAFIRGNDATLAESAEKIVQRYEQELLPAESVSEFLDMIGMLEDMGDLNPAQFIDDTLRMLR